MSILLINAPPTDDTIRYVRSWPLVVVTGVILGLIACVFGANWINARERGAQKRTLTDMRTLATAVESYSITNNQYPEWSGPASGVAALLEPTYVKVTPVRDAWGTPFQLDSTTGTYAIRSLGSDCRRDDPKTRVAIEGETSTFEADLVFENGTFTQFPDGSMR